MIARLFRSCFILSLFVMQLTLSGCVTAPAPNDEYIYAKLAIDYARSVQSVKYSPGYWHQAEEFYRQAKILYTERQHLEARELFIKARLSAEKAENSTRLLRQKNGDIL
jgi:Domain of unknown function (DUF4398)